MPKNTDKILVPEEVIMSKIYFIRGQKVMLDRDLAELYGAETRRLNEQVKRNIDRFPEDFMFQLTNDEFKNLKSQIATSSWGGTRKLPLAFSEHGVLMLSSVLNSERAIKVNIQIMRVYINFRKLMITHKEILQKLEQLQEKDIEQDQKILLIFEYLKQFEEAKQQHLEQSNRKQIGYRKSDKE